MDEEREQILQMVEAGTITADEAGALLSALEGDEGVAHVEAEQERLPAQRPWEIPFFGGLIVAALGVLGLSRPRPRGRRSAMLGRAGAWATILVGLLATVVGFWSRTASWLHLHVSSQEGENVNLHMPLPLFLADWFIGLAGQFADEDTTMRLQSLADFVDTLRRGEETEPFSMEIEEGDGNRVLLQID